MDTTMMQKACASTERFVDHVTIDQLTLPTPCSAWDVRALLNHLLGTLALGEALLSDRPPAVSMGPGQLPDVDLIGDDLVKSYRVRTEALLAAATDDAIGQVHVTPIGDMPGALLAGFTTMDILVHGWDLARATGQDPTLDAELAEPLLAFARGAITNHTRAPRIGPEVAAGPGAPATDRLVAYLGRTP
jgi:uncharacterized protein (TIGR03086 family)